MQTFWQDLRYGARMLMKKPGFTIIAVLALALGIGANTAIFSVVNGVLLRPLPYADSSRLAVLWGTQPKLDLKVLPNSGPDFVDWKNQNTTFERLAAFEEASFNLAGEGEAERVESAAVSADLFTLLGVQPQTGRSFNSDEEKSGHNKVAVLSYRLWQRRFGANPNLVGQPIALNGEGYTVVGVMPANFRFPEGNKTIDVWVPLVADTELMNQRGHRDLLVVGRLKQGVTLAQAQTEMSVIANRIAQQYPGSNEDWGVSVVSLQKQVTAAIEPALLVLFVAVGCVLLIACANVANLSLARAATRQKEVAIRLALGASRGRLVRQFLTESMLLAVLGGALGLLLAFWGVDALVSLLPEDVPRVDMIGVDRYVLGFTLLVSLVTGVLLGLVPAQQATKPDLTEALKEGRKSLMAISPRNRVRSLLVISEVALALVLLIGAGLMLKSFRQLQKVDPGFNPQNVLTMQIALPELKYEEEKQQAIFFHQLLERVESLPGVVSAGISTNLPFREDSQSDFNIEGRPEPETVRDALIASNGSVSPNYFRAFGIPVLKGRAFTEQDTADSMPVAVINETLARRYWPNEDPLGKRLRLGAEEDGAPLCTIVGIVGDVRHYDLDKQPNAELYFPYQQQPKPSMSLVVRTASDPLKIIAAVRNEVQAIDREQPVYNVVTMESRLTESIASRRLSVMLLGIFAVLALVLASVGIYGVVSYSVTQRTHEIGVRMALGAQARDVLRLVVGQGMLIALIGVAVGLTGAFALTRLMSSLLYGVSATDPLTFVVISLTLSLVALVACYLPARRAMKVDPMVALRYE
jgi:putative ABC transport system permease protein